MADGGDLLLAEWNGGTAKDVITAATELSTVASYMQADSLRVKRMAKRVFLLNGHCMGTAPEWTAPQLAEMRRLIPSIEDLLPKGIYLESSKIFNALPMRTSVQIFCEVFPQLAETILYSAELTNLDHLIDSWRNQKRFGDYTDYLYVRRGFRLNRNRRYSWWNLAERDDVTIGKRTLAQAKEHHVAFEKRTYEDMYIIIANQ